MISLVSNRELPTKRRGVVLSDTHFLGKRWAQCGWRLNSGDLDGLCKDADIVVLNGDMFDYDYSHMRVENWLQCAEDIVSGWLKANPNAEFHYIFGNHDELEPWLERLKLLVKEFPGKLHLHETEWQVGNAFFTHGDYATNDSMCRNNKRTMVSYEKMVHEYSQQLKKLPLEAFVAGGQHESEKRIKQLNRFIEVLKQKNKLDNVEHLFSGHFHNGAVNLEIPGFPNLKYHNTGSSTVGASFTPFFFDMEQDDRISNVRLARPLELVPSTYTASH